MIAMDVLRWITIQALMGKTWAEGRVFDSPATPTDLRMEEEQAPFISVFTDDADFDIDDDQSLATGDMLAYLTIEVAVGAAATIKDVEENQPTDPDDDALGNPVRIDTTDSGLEAMIGFISRQVNQALIATDNPWSELWREMTTPGRVKVEIRRGGQSEDRQNAPGVRFASRLLRYHVRILNEPVYGEAPDPAGFWGKLLAAMDGDESQAELGAILRAHFEFPHNTKLPGWREAQKIMTLTEFATRGVVRSDAVLFGTGFGPVIISDEAEPPLAEEGTILDDTGGPSVTVAAGEEGDPVEMEQP